MPEQLQIYTPDKVDLAKVIPVYQSAFTGDPWFEVSKCEDPQSIQRCTGGLSSLAVGSACSLCGEKTRREAYEKKDLELRFKNIAASRPTAWYLENNELGTTLAALAWVATPSTIANEKYADNPNMLTWMQSKLGDAPIVWLDEVFADREKKPKGNLKNFKTMCEGLSDILGNKTIAYRTIAVPMVLAPQRNFGENASIYQRKFEVPDRRDFVIIRRGGEKI